MKIINLPPFYVGQRVVCVDNSARNQNVVVPVNVVLKKGKEYSIMAIEIKCCKWLVHVGIMQTGTFRCIVCNNQHSAPEYWFSPNRFAPIAENFQSITLEKVLETETPLICVN